MKRPSGVRSRWRIAPFLSAAWLIASLAAAAEPETDPAAALLVRYLAASERLAQSPFRQQLEVESFEDARTSGSDIYAIVNHPIARVGEALTNPTGWCDALILHFNVKYCHPTAHDERIVLSVAIGKKREQPLRSAHHVEFDFGVVALRPDYVAVELVAAKGPYGTGNYRIALEAVRIDDERSFVHVWYSYTYGFVGRVAMQMYLATSGSGKVGFTIIGDPNDPRPKFIGGARGAIERNTMRYYLAIEAYLDALATPATERFEQSAEQWFSATERFSLQLHEIGHDSYISMKRNEYRRQQSTP